MPFSDYERGVRSKWGGFAAWAARAPESFVHLVIWSSGHLVILFGHLVIFRALPMIR
jgi:hypothetical protein